MSTPITTFSRWDHPRHLSQPTTQQNYFSLIRLDAEQRINLSHYAIHMVLRGEVRYQVGIMRWSLSSGQYLLINPGQELKLSPQGNQEIEIICLHLCPDTLAKALDDQAITSERELELIACLCPEGKIELCEQVYESGQGLMGNYLRDIAKHFRHSRDRSNNAQETLASEVASNLVRCQLEAYDQMLNLTSAKLSTKRELYRRLCQARIYMHAHLDETLDLDTLAQVACLSKYHFIRLFKEAFGQTPRQYLIARRLERASSLLIHSNKTFHEICQEVGLKDSSSFGRLFKRSFGATPHLYRQMYA